MYYRVKNVMLIKAIYTTLKSQISVILSQKSRVATIQAIRHNHLIYHSTALMRIIFLFILV